MGTKESTWHTYRSLLDQPTYCSEILTHYFKDRTQFERMYAFLQQHPQFLPTFADEVQLGIDELNHPHRYETCTSMTPNAIQLRTVIHDPLRPRLLPTFASMFDSTLPETIATVTLINQWMERGETETSEQPSIRWHHRRHILSAHTLTAGWLMDTYGVYATLTLLGYTHPPATYIEQMIVKDGIGRTGGGSETVMPAIEEMIGLKQRTKGYSIVLQAVTPWLKVRYRFSASFLQMVADDFGIELAPNAFGVP